MTSAILTLAAAVALQSGLPEGRTPEERREYVEKNVNAAVERGLQALRNVQGKDGTLRFQGEHALGVTSLAVYTMLACGVPVQDPAVQKALRWIVENHPFARPADRSPLSSSATYQISLLAVGLGEAVHAFRAAGRKGEMHDACLALLHRAARWLVDAQKKPDGGWDYNTTREGHDHSNTQFAIMGLQAAANAGIKIDREAWEREVRHLKNAQFGDDGWDYLSCYSLPNPGAKSTFSMTAAGVMGVVMAMSALVEKEERAAIADDDTVRKGLAALERHARGRFMEPDYYALYGMERACMLTGTRKLGELDWYPEAAWFILKWQGADGAWTNGPYGIPDTCFALLFLKRVYVPVEPKPAEGKPREFD